ncbi:MAG: hypothetical protein IT436_15630 [Phycisphaerales bacterium]|nr:hypothetical protein [Phycisphaerales bacterium]
MDPVRVLAGDVAAIKRDIGNLISAGAESTTAKAKETAAMARQQIEDARSALGRSAARRPVATIAVSMVAGMAAAKLLGWAMRR